MKNKEKIPEEGKNNLEKDRESQLAEYFSPDEEKLEEMSEKGHLLMNEAEETNDEKKEILAQFEWAKGELYKHLEVDNLSNIEAFRLRKIVGECIKQKEHEDELGKQGRMRGPQMITLSPEAARRWLWELYGIHWDDVPTIFLIKDKTTGKTYKYYNRQEEDKKYEELEAQGHDVNSYTRIPGHFKEYIHRLREKAHKP